MARPKKPTGNVNTLPRVYISREAYNSAKQVSDGLGIPLNEVLSDAVLIGMEFMIGRKRQNTLLSKKEAVV